MGNYFAKSSDEEPIIKVPEEEDKIKENLNSVVEKLNSEIRETKKRRYSKISPIGEIKNNLLYDCSVQIPKVNITYDSFNTLTQESVSENGYFEDEFFDEFIKKRYQDDIIVLKNTEGNVLVYDVFYIEKKVQDCEEKHVFMNNEYFDYTKKEHIEFKLK